MRVRLSAETADDDSLQVFTDRPANCLRLPDGTSILMARAMWSSAELLASWICRLLSAGWR